MGDWKAVRPQADEPLELYNLKTDLGEKQDVAKNNPEVVAKFEAYFKTARTESPELADQETRKEADERRQQNLTVVARRASVCRPDSKARRGRFAPPRTANASSSLSKKARLLHGIISISRHEPTRSIGATCISRRRFLSSLGLASAFFAVPGAFAERWQLTPAQTEGPFYPDKLPLDTDNDLIVINDAHHAGRGARSPGSTAAYSTPAANPSAMRSWKSGRRTIRAFISIAAATTPRKRDGNFQGFGRFLTGSSGEYLFRTIKPVPYPGRTPHVHFAVKIKGRDKFTTQCYVQGEPRNERDSVLQDISDPKARTSVIVPFTPLKDSRAGELTARFDVVHRVYPGSVEYDF